MNGVAMAVAAYLRVSTEEQRERQSTRRSARRSSDTASSMA
jgi:DNA invertase Pin-like site-specific DNA recombinase